MEHLVFFGSQKNPFRGFIDQFSINQLCSPINAITSQDHTKFMFSGVKIEKVVARLIEQLLKPFWPEEAFYTEIFDPKSNTGVMFYELCDREFDLKLISPLECRKVLYSNFGSFNCDASGSAANLRNGECQFTAVRNYHEKHYKPFNFGIFVHGNLDLEELQGDLKSVLEHYTLEPKMVEVRDKVKSDSLRIMTLPCPNEDLFLTLSWEIILDDLEATKVLLEFFKKNHSVLFSNFAYEIMILDSDHANVCVTFEDFEELDEEKMAIKMKKSIAEYMNQVGKDSFLECLKSALQLTKVRNQLEDETNPHEKVMRSFTNHFLYHFEEEGQIVENDFTFWYNVTKRWVRENWGVVVINGSQKLYEKEVKSHKFHSKQPTPRKSQFSGAERAKRAERL